MIHRGRLPGDRLVRIEPIVPRAYSIRPRRRQRRPLSPPAVLVTGFALLVAVGTIVLMLPVSTAAGRTTDPVTALFTATSAVCVTGLAVVDTAKHWSPFGEAAILVMVQVGGFGFMTGSTLLLLLLVGRRTGLRDRMLVQASTGELELGSVVSVIRRVAAFTIVVEAVGAVALFAAFLVHGLEPGLAAWWGAFHSIAAFNNAGFDLVGDFRGLADFATDPFVLIAIGTLVVLGGLGFAIVGDALGKRRWSRLALETKVVLAISLVLLAGGALAIGALEWSNPATLGAIPPEHRPINALFESATLRSAGFSVIPQGDLLEATLFIAMALMFIGGASGSTAGGIKVNTIGVLSIVVASTVAGRRDAGAFGRRVPDDVVHRALSVALLAVAFVFAVAVGIALLAGTSFVASTFEAVSAFATAGLTMGITPELSDPARLLVALAMFVGRLGPLTLVLALAARQQAPAHRPAIESMRIG